MDSLTHVFLGAVAGELSAGKKVGNKALVYGAMAGNIPDIDVIFTPLFNPVDALFVHRGFSHSLLLLFLLAPILAYTVSKIDRDSRLRYVNWLWLMALPWFSHLMVDIFNTYGTAIFEPFSSIRVSYDSVAIVDVFLWIVLIPATISIWFTTKNKTLRRRVAWISMSLVVVYVGASVIIKKNLESTVKNELAVTGKEYLRIQTAPLPLGNLIWMVVVEETTGYSIEQRSVWNFSKLLSVNHIPKNHELLSPIANKYEIRRLIDFTRGLYSVEKEEQGFLIYDIRYASLAENYPNAYVFTFRVDNWENHLTVSRAHPRRSINFRNTVHYVKKAKRKQVE
ncbi:MAG: metal-dependent hydrolase [Bacteroidales bacterium]